MMVKKADTLTLGNKESIKLRNTKNKNIPTKKIKLKFDIYIGVSTKKVWKYLADAKKLIHWYPPTKNFKFKIGGDACYYGKPETPTLVGKFKKIIQGKLIVQTFKFTLQMPHNL
jgi:uncharacterized protein YndB with AHSA1/START domain